MKHRPTRKMSEIMDIDEPDLKRQFFPYVELPRVKFDGKNVPMNLPKEIWVTDTTFRDGQQAREPYTMEQMVELYDLMYRLGGKTGAIRFTEFFLYTKRDREAVTRCLAKGYEYPKVTGWIRAHEGDFELVKEAGVKETGILTSLSDYHIFYKFGLNRRKSIEKYLSIVEACLKSEIIPRCHVEDVTRAEVRGVVIPFIQRLMKISEDYGMPCKVRLCDTLGLGVPFPEVKLPRSIPKLVHTVINDGGIPSEWLEFHTHNDFHLAVVNSVAAWIYGCCGNNGTLLGIGERTGNTPLEGLIFQLIELKGGKSINTEVITEIADYYEKIGYDIPLFYPIVGRNFNMTRAGIHADGMIKNPEIYMPYDSGRILRKPPRTVIGSYSGAAGVAWWVNDYLSLKDDERLHKDHPVIQKITEAVSREYSKGRVTSFSDYEMKKLLKELPLSSLFLLPERWKKLTEQ